MDSTDEKILDYLRDEGRASFTDIASDVGVSEGTVRNRVKKLQEEGIIERFTVKTREAGVSAVVMASVSTGREMSAIVADLPGETEVYEVTGDFDLVVKISRTTVDSLNEAIDSIRAVDGVESTRTYSVLKSHKL